jgi:hypothetical protein
MASRKRRSSSSVRSPISTSSSGAGVAPLLGVPPCHAPGLSHRNPSHARQLLTLRHLLPRPGYTERTSRSDESAFRVTNCQRSLGANCGSQHPQTHLRRSRPSQTVAAGERLCARLPQTTPDTGFVPGVKGSPVQILPTRRRSEATSWIPGVASWRPRERYWLPASLSGAQRASRTGAGVAG